MAETVINLNPFNPASIAHAERILRERERAFERNTARFFVELAEIGRQAAAGAYGPAISMELQPLDDGVSIVANGKAVVFLEFGAGAAVNTGNRYADQMPFEVARGSYSDQNVGYDGRTPGEYARSGYRQWHFGNTVLTEVQPRNGMEKAYEAVMTSIYRVAREVFGS